jgi:hypothetical protein
MAYEKFNVVDKLRMAEKALNANVSPCSVCKGVLGPVCMGAMLDLHRARSRREQQVRRARRAGNLIQFPISR